MAREEKQWQVWCPQLSAGAPRCAEPYVEPSAPLQPAQWHWGSRKHNFLPIIIFPIMSQIRKKPLAESNDGSNFVSRTKLDTILVLPWGLRKQSCADRYQQQRSTKCTCRLQENRSLFHAQQALLARRKQSGARQWQHKASVQLFVYCGLRLDMHELEATTREARSDWNNWSAPAPARQLVSLPEPVLTQVLVQRLEGGGKIGQETWEEMHYCCCPRHLGYVDGKFAHTTLQC